MEMTKIILPIHKEYADRIYSGEKTLEIRKTAPKAAAPYIVYMYETKNSGGGGVITGSFICKGIIKTSAFNGDFEGSFNTYRKEICNCACLSEEAMKIYAGTKSIIALNVSTPTRFGVARSLSEFDIKQAPQGWMYIR